MFRMTKEVTLAEQFILEAANGNDTFVKQQLALDPALINKVDSRGSTALVAAAANGHAAVVDILIASAGVDVNKTDKNGYSALLWAAYNNHLNVVQALLKAGAAVSVQDQWGNTPLYCAVENKNLSMAVLLLQQPGNLFEVKQKETKLTALELAEKRVQEAKKEQRANDQLIYERIVGYIEAAQPVVSSSSRPGM